ncbi:MAG: sodium:proton antiporter [Clostridia bacterium]|nr:sodium:proton antiporter [Clostridia bacterium]
MASSVNFPLFSIVLCFMSAVLAALISGRAARAVTLALCALTAAGALILMFFGIRTGAATEYLMGHFPHPWGNELRFGILEPLLVLLFSLVMLLTLLGGRKQLELDLEKSKSNLYYMMCDLVLASLIALSYTNDIFTGYVFLEICTIAACGLLMIRQIGRTTLAATRYMIFSLIGSGLFLLGIVFLYAVTGQLLMPDLKAAIVSLWANGSYRTVLITGISLVSIGLAVKSGLFPFHFWMPDTYGYATPSSGGILSGLVSKGYIFLLIKLVLSVFTEDVFYKSGLSNVLYVLGAAGIIVGSIGALMEKDVFRMVAYSSAAQIGYIFMGIGISPDLGMLAAVYHIMTHALTKPMLFLASAQLSQAAGGKKRENWLGAAHFNRAAGAAFGFGTLSMIGIPLTMGFVSKYRFALAAFEKSELIVPTLVVLAASTILNAMYFIRVLVVLYSSPAEDKPRVRIRDQIPFAVSAALLILMNLAAGTAAKPLVGLISRGLGLM